jgi:cytochrome c peroxidase
MHANHLFVSITKTSTKTLRHKAQEDYSPLSWSLGVVVVKWWIVSIVLLYPFSSNAQSPSETNSSTSVLQDTLQPPFIPPPPGTYSLPTIDTVDDHQLLDSVGKPVSLFGLTKGKIAVVSFMYTSCSDVGGCPLAAAVLQQLDQLLSKRPEISQEVALLSVSFDPERDTPSHLAEIRAGIAPHSDWYFLTSQDPAALQPVLADFNQPVAKLWHDDGQWSGLFRHVLKVYLLDTNHQVRNIYSVGLFSAQLVLNDIETILLEGNKRAAIDKQR